MTKKFYSGKIGGEEETINSHYRRMARKYIEGHVAIASIKNKKLRKIILEVKRKYLLLEINDLQKKVKKKRSTKNLSYKQLIKLKKSLLHSSRTKKRRFYKRKTRKKSRK